MTPLWIVQLSVQETMAVNHTSESVQMKRPDDDTDLLITIAQDLNMYYVPFILTFGLSLHVLCCLGFTRTDLRKKFFTQIFLAISIADVGFLLTLLLLWLSEQTIDIYRVPGMCPMVIFMSHFFPFLSFWHSEAAAIIIIFQPSVGFVNKFSRGSGNGKILVICLSVLSFTVYLYKTWTNGVLTIKGIRYCTVLPETQEAMKVLNIFDVLFLLILPLIGFLTFDTIVIFRYAHFYWQCQRRMGPRMKIAKDAMRVIIAQSVCFVLLVGPGCLSKIVFYAKGGHWNSEINVRDFLLQNLFQFLFYTYFAVTPFVHIMVSNSFRTHVRLSFETVKRNSHESIFQTEQTSDQTLL